MNTPLSQLFMERKMNKAIQRRNYMRCWRKEHPILAKRRTKESLDKHPTRYAHQRHVSEIKWAIYKILGERPKRLTSLEDLYPLLVTAVKTNRRKAKERFPHGIPDAENFNVEFKVGFDRLHSGQLVRDILFGQRTKVRWFPSYDSIEKKFKTGVDDSKVFQSYKDFILWRYGVK
jgi:hypothetical protein